MSLLGQSAFRDHQLPQRERFTACDTPCRLVNGVKLMRFAAICGENYARFI
jgi:hypothetical protein